MLNSTKRSCNCRMLFLGRLLAASAMLCLCLQCACSKKSKAPVAVIAPVRVVLLPFGVPADNKDLQWEAMAAPILLAKASELAPDLVVVPLWEAMPTAIQSAGASRIFTQESAASVATWLSAKWSILGDISATKTGITTIVDFIPAKNNQIAFRYMKARRTDFLGSDSREAIMQFLRYLVARPLESAKGNLPNMTSVKTLAEALNREYGWLVDADPGKAQEVVANLARSDDRLARLLFNPSLYPALAQAK